jgi:hypothetical protein
MSLFGSAVACCGIVAGAELVGAAAGGRSAGAGCAGVMPVSIFGAFVGTAVSLRGGVVGFDAGRVGVVVTVPAAGAD